MTVKRKLTSVKIVRLAGYSAGEIAGFPAEQIQSLVDHGQVERLDSDNKRVVLAGDPEGPVNRMMDTGKNRRKRKGKEKA